MIQADDYNNQRNNNMEKYLKGHLEDDQFLDKQSNLNTDITPAQRRAVSQNNLKNDLGIIFSKRSLEMAQAQLEMMQQQKSQNSNTTNKQLGDSGNQRNIGKQLEYAATDEKNIIGATRQNQVQSLAFAQQQEQDALNAKALVTSSTPKSKSSSSGSAVGKVCAWTGAGITSYLLFSS